MLVIFALQQLFYRTAIGRAFRATSDDPEVAQLMGSSGGRHCRGRYIFSQIAAVGSGSGMSLPAKIVKAITTGRDEREFLIYWLFLALTLVVVGAIVILLRTRYGLALTAIRDNEVAAKK